MRIRVKVPASAGNTGPGFDSFGLAYGLYNEITVDTGAPGMFEVKGEGSAQLEAGTRNLVTEAMERFVQETGAKLPAHGLQLLNRIPFSRGLGSSAAAIVGGLLAADALADTGLDRDALLRLALLIENHPDNLSAALYGGAVLTVFEDSVRGPFRVLQLQAPEGWRAVVFIPDEQSGTEEARALLPREVPRRHAIFNHSRVGLLVAAFLQERPEYLDLAMQDRLHQPYRSKLFPAMGRLIEAAHSGGAWGACLSGAGPAVLALTSETLQGGVLAALEKQARELEISGKAVALEIPPSGAQVEVDDR